MEYSNRKVLVVDTDSHYREEVCSMLERIGFDRLLMFCVENVSEANEIITADQHIDLIFLEVSGTHGPDGYSVCAFVTRIRERTDIPIFLTFIGKLGPFRDASIHAHCFVEKPVMIEDLTYKVDRFMHITIMQEEVDRKTMSNTGACCGEH